MSSEFEITPCIACQTRVLTISDNALISGYRKMTAAPLCSIYDRYLW